ncbi:hypothetical protein OsJ_15218 [Oryza sativa Japonica Group]|uniref:Uncharacterized protein n=1 Tax=Oryza sativa subsp. japonica TaxID=39947 RepID=A3AUY2_ORYSJ|nr:hypothetical protein OsJ_15218 [Oryza sativa Japonica Group]
MMAGGDLRSLLAVVAAVAAAMSYVRFVARRLRPGLPRLAAFVPLLAVLPVIPLAFRALHLRVTSGFFLGWLAEFKLLLLASGHGPLDTSLPLPAFVAIASLPVRRRAQRDSENAPRPGLGLVTSAVMAALLATIVSVYPHKERMNEYVLLMLYSLHVYLALELVLAFAAAAARPVMGMDLKPQFDRPYLSASLRDFWGKRWKPFGARAAPPMREPPRARARRRRRRRRRRGGARGVPRLGDHARGGDLLRHAAAADGGADRVLRAARGVRGGGGVVCCAQGVAAAAARRCDRPDAGVHPSDGVLAHRPADHEDRD